MKSAGVLTSKAREHHALGASVAAMLLVVLASALASAQSAADTAASAAWKTAAASASTAVTAPPAAGAPIAEAAVPAPSPLRAVVAPSGYSGKDAMPSNMVSTQPALDGTQPGIAEILPTNSGDAQSQTSNEANDVARYQEEQSGMPPEQLRRMQFDADGELSTPFGMQLREAKRSLKSGEDLDGLLITAVTKDGPAASVGLRAYTHTVHDALAGAAMVGAMVPGGQFAILLIPVLDMMQVGESYDMIIGVDGSRVTNFLDFQDRTRDLQPGEIVYLSVLRDGKRLQVTMPVTANIVQAATN